MTLFKEEESDLQKLFKAQRLALYWLLGFIYLAFIGLQLGRVQAITNFNYSLHEILYLPFNLAIFIVPVLFLIYLYYVIKYLRKRGKQKINNKTRGMVILVIASIITIFSITEHQFHEVSTGGVFEVEQKVYIEGKYFLVFNNQQIEVSMNEFKLVEVNKEYVVSYIWNSRSPNKGRLEAIELMK
ncbi:hypothetical protein [Paenisporosarcina sp. TG20]|uniref:hypothetical protein n=1 Tax=Paenisporosarcina sp. TG20 TaxID=1211706 RepID=UPI000316DD8C|nr:hypothetical protein [Paenisporosarcina sp. TG20]